MMKYLRKFFENSLENYCGIIKDYFFSVSDEHNLRIIENVGDTNFVYHTRSHIADIMRSLSLVNLSLSNINGCYCITSSDDMCLLTIKYTRGKLTFPEFSDDIGIFRKRLIDDGFKVEIVRGSQIDKKLLLRTVDVKDTLLQIKISR